MVHDGSHRRPGRWRAAVGCHVHPLRPADGGTHLAAALRRTSRGDARSAASHGEGDAHRSEGGFMRLPNSAHEAHPWVIAQIAPDFRLLDVWALPVQGGHDDRDSALDLLASIDPANADCAASRALFALRLRLGAWFGWDDPVERRPIPGCTESTLRARLPDHL